MIAYVQRLQRPKRCRTATATSPASEVRRAVRGLPWPDGKGNAELGAPNLTDDFWLYGGSCRGARQIAKGRNGAMPAHRERLGETRVKLLAPTSGRVARTRRSRSRATAATE